MSKELLPERILSRLEFVTESGCLIWTGGENGCGYGTVWLNKKRRYVHRLLYECFVGEIPSGMEIDHLCRVRCCANPLHLHAVTSRQNTLLGIGPAALNASKVSCKEGHALTPDNIYLRYGRTGNEERGCRICTLKWNRQYKAKRRARDAGNDN